MYVQLYRGIYISIYANLYIYLLCRVFVCLLSSRRYLLAKGLDPNLRDSVGQTCLFYAAREGRTSCLIVLLQGGGDPNVLDINKQTCLFYASRDNRIEAVKALLQAGADPNIKDTLRRTAWSFAKGNNHNQICALLKNASATYNPAAHQHHPHTPGSSTGFDSVAAAQQQLLLQQQGASVGGLPAAGCSSMSTPMDLQQHQQQQHMKSSSSIGSGSTAGFGDDMHQRKKYRLQYQPLPSEMPDVWVDCPIEKLEEFERLFPSLAVWPPPAASGATGSPGGDPAAAGGTSPVDLSAAACIGRCEALMQQWQSGAHALLNGLSRYEGSHIFEKPVDRKVAPGYYDVVTRPMSLSCVRTKLRKGAYVHPHAFLSDVQLIFDNCALYNQPGSWINTIGKNMQRFFLNQVTHATSLCLLSPLLADLLSSLLYYLLE